jgi:hypothetical protein
MARRPKRDSGASWISNIAALSGADAVQVEEVLERRRIKASPVMPSPRRLILKRIAFSGEKRGTVTEGPFKFEWSDLEPGLYGVLSDGNLKGKSSILHVARWLLRGEPASGLQQDVKSWIQQASLRFALNDAVYDVRLDDPALGVGSVLQLVAKGWSEVARFGSHSEFKAAMSSFFLRELALDAFPTWNDEYGKEVIQDWAALSGALSMGPTFDSLLGEVPMAGLPTRLMQMYLGLPWVPTYCAARVAKSAMERENDDRTKRQEQAQREQMTRVLDLEAQLSKAQQELKLLPTFEDYQTQHRAASAALLAAQEAKRRAWQELETAKSAQVRLDEAELADRRRVVEITDIIAAGRVFRALDPKCCPRCDALVTEARRKKEQATSACAMCGETLMADDDGEAELSIAKETAAKSKAAAEGQRAHVKSADAALRAAERGVVDNEGALSKLEGALRAGERRSELMLAVAGLEARLAELRRVVAPRPSEPTLEPSIIAETVKECEARVKEKQEGVLTDVSAQIVHFARRFGMIQLSEATLRGNASLEIVKGGKTTSFSKVTVGEQLRLKIATVLAILKSGEKRGIGRHPGLLLIDSPGAQELAGDNLEDLMRELKAASKELQHLQVFVAAVESPPMLNHIDTKRTKRSDSAGWMW